MTLRVESYSEKEFEQAFEQILGGLLSSPDVKPAVSPCAVLLGGQSGAGKTYLHAIFRKRFARNVAVINGDEYRSFYPRFAELDATYGKDAVSHTAAWAAAMTEALIGALSRAKCNLVIEGTLRTSEVPLKTAALLRGRGYKVSLALMAVKPRISLASCQLRYQMMRRQGAVPRATDPAYHDAIVRGIADNLTALEESGAFDGIFIYDRRERCLFPDGSANRSASDVLRNVLFGEWTEEERAHLSYLEEQLERLRR